MYNSLLLISSIMGFEGYAILGYRKSSLSPDQLQELIELLKMTECKTTYWMKWNGSHVDRFDSLLLGYSDKAEFFLLIIGEEGNLLEVVSYAHGKTTKSDFTMITLELFTGYSMEELSSLRSKKYEEWITSYEAYKRKFQALTADALGLTLISLEAPPEIYPSDSDDEHSSEEDEVSSEQALFKWQYEIKGAYKDLTKEVSDIIEKYYQEYVQTPRLKEVRREEHVLLGSHVVDFSVYRLSWFNVVWNIRRVVNLNA